MRPRAGLLPHHPDLDVDLVMAVAAAGAVGALIRWIAGEVFPSGPGQFPWPTFTVNIVGSGLAGLLAGLRPSWLGPRSLTILLVGVLGGFTTFSTFSLNGLWMIERAQWWFAAAWLIGSTLLGLAAAAAGYLVGVRRSHRLRPEPGAAAPGRQR